MIEYGVIVIRAGGDTYFQPTDEDITLHELQDMVDGSIETVPICLSGNWTTGRGQPIMIVNEEGKLLGFEKNERATDMLRFDVYDYVSGTAIIAGAKGENIVPLKRSDCERIIEAFLDK